MTIPDLGSSLPDVAIRSALIYGLLIFGLRMGGKRNIGQLTIPDLAVLLLISNAVQNAMVGSNQTVAGGVVGGAAILASSRLIQVLARRFPLVRRLLRGDPKVLIAKGELNRKVLEREEITAAELAAALRSRGITDRRKVRLAVLEVDGSISLIEWDQQARETESRPKRAGRVKPPEEGP